MLILRRSLCIRGLLWCGLSACVYMAPAASAASLYTYTDDAGVLILTTELDAIPEKYRSRLTRHDAEQPADQVVSPLLAAPPQVVTAGGEYRMGDHDTRADATRLAVEAAKKNALEQVATYLESVTEVRNLDLTRDDIQSYTAGIVKVLEQTITIRLEDQTVVVRADLTAEVDPQNIVHRLSQK